MEISLFSGLAIHMGECDLQDGTNGLVKDSGDMPGCLGLFQAFSEGGRHL